MPSERHETQPFRTKWTLDVQNLDKIAIYLVHRNPFARNGRWTSKTEKKNVILHGPPQPFGMKWTLDVKNWGKIAILLGPPQPFRTKWTLDTQNLGKIAN